MNIVILRSQVGNFKSIYTFFDEQKFKVDLTNDIKKISSCDLLVIPGAASFSGFMDSFNQNIIDSIRERNNKKKLIFGICAGFQVLFDQSEESPKVKGLSLIKGKIVKLKDGKERKPHLGWYETIFNKEKSLNNSYYYVNNYGLEHNSNINNFSYYYFNNKKYIGAFKKENIIGSQFHPEKSSTTGLKFLKKFVLS
tara:strand:+ start:4324 stop:4911 length:588 start_codon:yes stop_codon:yes gene_type:complete